LKFNLPVYIEELFFALDEVDNTGISDSSPKGLEYHPIRVLAVGTHYQAGENEYSKSDNKKSLKICNPLPIYYSK